MTLKPSVERVADRAGEFTLKVQMDIAEGWYTYDDGAGGIGVATSLELVLPEGVSSKGPWARPMAKEYGDEGLRVFTGRAVFSRTLLVEPGALGEELEVMASYQACNADLCNPPRRKGIKVQIPIGASTEGQVFDTPVRLQVGDQLLNHDGKKRFLSPALFDVDGDGARELVTGDLMGGVSVHQNLNVSGTGDPQWGPRAQLKDAEGKTIRTSNW